MADIECPKCHELAEPAAHVRNVMVCGACGGTLTEADADGPIRPARLTDIDALTPAEKRTVVAARRPLVARFQPQ